MSKTKLKKTIKNKKEAQRFTNSFLTIMLEYYTENNIKDYDIFEINWDNIDEVSQIATNHNNAVEYTINKIKEVLRENSEHPNQEIAVLEEWFTNGDITQCKYYKGLPSEQRIEMLSQYIKETEKTATQPEKFKLQQLEKQLKEYKKEK